MMINAKYYTTILLSVLLLFSCTTDTEENETITLGEDTSAAVKEDTPPAEATENYTWKTYRNERFNFCVKYPEDFLRPQQVAQNADGRKFIGPDNLAMQVYGYNNVLGQNLDEAMQYELKNNPQKKITDKEVHPGYFSLNGIENGMAFQEKTFLQGEDFKVIRMEYPPELENEFRPIIDHILNSFPNCNGAEAM